MKSRVSLRCLAPAILACLTVGCVLGKYEVEATQQPDAAAPEVIVKSGKIDVLLMVDNSASMADKQGMLAEVVPDLVQALTKVKDVHYGVITSSLGSLGTDSCNKTATEAEMAHLVARDDPKNLGSIGSTWQSKGFLFWDPNQTGAPAGDHSALSVSDRLSKFVVGATETGCGFEASLESWYRFLADPMPYQSMVAKPCNPNDTNNMCREPEGIDDALMQQRASFLRPDSLVVVVMLTDENDCSVIAGGQNPWLLQQYFGSSVPFRMRKGTSACETDPASPDCRPCGEDTASDPYCIQGGTMTETDDPSNLRCFRQKQRFGIDALYPVRRYVNALTKKRMTADDAGWPAGGGALQQWVNPLFCAQPSADWQTCLGGERDPSQVVLAGIVGVPWQDIARDPYDLSKGILPAGQINWSWIVGDWEHHKDPLDPLMVEARSARWGKNPATGMELGIIKANSPKANPINGHEWAAEEFGDLQYACIFPLPDARECTTAPGNCDCTEPEGRMNPLCQDDSGNYGTLQFRAKAYPSIRPLTVLQGLGDRAVVGSICAANVTNNSAPEYAYRPVVNAIMDVINPRIQ